MIKSCLPILTRAKRFLGRLSVRSLGFVLLVVNVGCASPVLPSKPHRGIEGEYSGLLRITTTNVIITDNIVFEIKLSNPDDFSEGVYSHRFDTLALDTADMPDICDMLSGVWFIRNGKIVLEPGAVEDTTCDVSLLPTSLVEVSVDSVVEVSFGFITINTNPPTKDIGDSLILVQQRPSDGVRVEFRLVLTGTP